MTASRWTAVVFDCADTLLRLDPPRERIFADAAAELGLAIDGTAIVRAYEQVDFALRVQALDRAGVEDRAQARRATNRMLCAALGIESAREKLQPLLLRRFAERRRWVPYEDVEPCLRALSPRLPIHVLANWHGDLGEVLARANLRPWLRSVHTSEKLGASKPARACFDAFAAATGVDLSAAIYVGNEYVADVVGSRAAGLTPVLVDRGDSLPGADCLRVRDLGDLDALLG